MEGTLAEIRMFAGNYVPKNWAYCQGQTINLNTNQALFSLLGTTYGGNGTQTFGLPDFRGRVAIGTGQGTGLTNRILGSLGGVNTATIAINNMPTHTHTATFTGSAAPGGPITATFKASTMAAAQNVPGTNGANAIGSGSTTDLAAIQVDMYVADANPTVPLASLSVALSGGSGGGTVTNANTGGSQPVTITQPFLGMNYVICLYGIYPSRN